tara:strand:+ start:152 stop:307 length:156 start_codon:yes stop_codon:yes gene_type:complete
MKKQKNTKKHEKQKKTKKHKKNKLSEARGAQPATTGRNRVRLPTERRALKV